MKTEKTPLALCYEHLLKRVGLFKCSIEKFAKTAGEFLGTHS